MHDRIAFGSFELDLRHKLLTRHGSGVALGSRAVEVLCELARAQGQLVAKGELLARVWPDTIVEENNLQVQISALRKLLAGEEGGRAWLQTVPGRGYRFVAPPARPAGLPQPAPADAASQAVQFVAARDGVHIAAAATGDGPTVLRTGLWMSHLEHEGSTHAWGPFNARLSQHCRLLRYDQRGTGLSDRKVASLTFETMVGDLEQVADRLGGERLALLGISQGAPTAIAFAARHPQRVSCLVLLGGYARGWRLRGSPELVARGEAFQMLTRQGWGQQNPVFRQIFTSLGMPDASREEMDAFNELQRLSATAEVAAELVGMTGTIDVTALLAQVRVPTLVLHSEHDAWVPVALGRELATGIAGAQFIALPSTSHVVLPREPAWERCVTSIIAFIGAHAQQPAQNGGIRI